jgi:hypothetical protein
MSLSSLSTSAGVQTNIADPSVKTYETSLKNPKIDAIVLKFQNQISSELSGISNNAAMSALPINAASEMSQYQPFINDFVTRFLHPYITGQINEDNESKERKSLVNLLMEKIPPLEPSQKEEVIEMAFRAYLKAAALGLYVNRKALAGIIAPYSIEFYILLNALETSIPKDFCDKKITKIELEQYVIEALTAVTKERKSLEQETKDNHRLDLSYEKILKLSQLKQSGELFFKIPLIHHKVNCLQLNQIEKDFLIILEKPTLEGLAFIENLLLDLDKNADKPSLGNKDISINLLAVEKKLLGMKHPKYGNQEVNIVLIQADLLYRYQYYIQKDRVDPSFCLFLINVTKILDLIEKLLLIKNNLQNLGINSSVIDLNIGELEKFHWDCIAFSTPFDNELEIQSITQKKGERYNIIIEICETMNRNKKFLILNFKIMDVITDFIENCFIDVDMSSQTIKEQFLKIFIYS